MRRRVRPMMLRPKFSLKTLLWLMAVVAAFYAGMACERHWARDRVPFDHFIGLTR